MKPGAVVYRVSGEDKAVKKAVSALQTMSLASGKVTRVYGDPQFQPEKNDLPDDADVIIIVTEVTKT